MQRLLIVGTSGSGKSTLARAAAERLGLPFIASDDYWWEPGWRPASDDAVRSRVQEVASQSAWVLESNFDSCRDFLWPRADLIVWLDFSRPVVFWRVLRRNVGEALRRAEVWSGNRMTVGHAASGVRHSIRSFSGKRQQYPQWLEEHAANHVRLRHPREATRWLRSLKTSPSEDDAPNRYADS